MKMDSLLQHFSEVDVVHGMNDRMATGIYQAAKRLGCEEEMLSVGIDTLPGKGNGVEPALDSVLDTTSIYLTEGSRMV